MMATDMLSRMNTGVTKYKLHDMNLYLPPLIKSDEHLRKLHNFVRRHCARRRFAIGESRGRSRNPDKRGFVVLCVDDSKVILKMTTSILQRAGCVVHTAANGLEALNLIYRRPPNFFDMILTDIEMPLMNGIDFVRIFREHERSPYTADSTTYIRTPVFCISSTLEDGLCSSAVNSGADVVMEKPFNSTLLHMACSFKTAGSEDIYEREPRKGEDNSPSVETQQTASTDGR